MKMEAVGFPKTSLNFYQTIRRYISGDCYPDVAVGRLFPLPLRSSLWKVPECRLWNI